MEAIDLHYRQIPLLREKRKDWMFHRIVVVLIVILFPFVTYAQQDELLTKNDVQRVMNDILSQHVDHKEMSGEVLSKAFQLYIDQFDPERVYLFKNEVDRLTNISKNDMNRILRQYNRGELYKFEEIDQVIQNAILRTRNYREEILKREDYLFQSSSDDPKDLELLDQDEKPPFTDNIKELKDRNRDEIIQFISGERQRYGDRAVMENRKRTLRSYLETVMHRENQYLYVNDDGKRLTETEKENLFVMHVLKALARSLDSHTTFLDQNEALDMKIRLEKGFKGIGVVLKRRPEGVVITRMIKDGPAMKSGRVQVGDLISEINGDNVEMVTLEELVDKLRDQTHPAVSLILKRKVDGKEQVIRVSLPRELIAVDEGRVDVQYEAYRDGIIGKLSMDSFYQGGNGVTSEKDMRKAIKDLQKQGKLKGLIIDLRENSGGFLNQAVKVAGLFITNGVVVVSKYSNGEKRYYRDMDGKVSFDGPIIILTSKATASAAEIVAQALQDYGVAIVVGDEQTYGKGTIQSQTVTDGPSSSHFKVTVGKYYTVSGKTPQVRGVKADIVVPSYYSKELIGEEYLEYPIEADAIPNSYQDSLVDVDAGLKPWYLRYYMPSLQKRETSWHELVKPLQSKSQRRLAQNPSYQKFLRGDWDWNPFLEDEQNLPANLDFQMQEAVSIMKDMIIMDKSVHEAKVADF